MVGYAVIQSEVESSTPSYASETPSANPPLFDANERPTGSLAAPLVQFGPGGGADLLHFGLSPLFPYGPIRPNTSPGEFP